MISLPSRMPSRSRSRRSRSEVALDAEPPAAKTSHGEDSAEITAPGALLLLLEGRAPWEFAASLLAAPWLRKLPRGDGHRVLVLPGLAANDLTTLPIRTFLKDRGYRPSPWEQGLNLGPRPGVLDTLRARVRELFSVDRRKISLVGWSLGGVYAREIAKEMPEMIRCVITLGSPFAGPPQATNAWWLYERVSGHPEPDAAMQAALRVAPPVPTTSIYSRTDGIVAWQSSLNPPGPLAENIRVHASHIGLGLNPLAMTAIADRLAQDPDDWHPFDTDGLRRFFFKNGS